MPKYDKISTEDFDRILAEIMNEDNASSLLTIPGVYEIVSEHFNNEVLEKWNIEQAISEEPDPVDAWCRENPDVVRRVHRMGREQMVRVLEDVACIQCYDRETTDELREALFANLADGTIKACCLPEE